MICLRRVPKTISEPRRVARRVSGTDRRVAGTDFVTEVEPTSKPNCPLCDRSGVGA